MDGAVAETNPAEGVGERMLVASWFNAGAAFAVTDSLAEAKEAGLSGRLAGEVREGFGAAVVVQERVVRGR